MLIQRVIRVVFAADVEGAGVDPHFAHQLQIELLAGDHLPPVALVRDEEVAEIAERRVRVDEIHSGLPRLFAQGPRQQIVHPHHLEQRVGENQMTRAVGGEFVHRREAAPFVEIFPAVVKGKRYHELSPVEYVSRPALSVMIKNRPLRKSHLRMRNP